MRHATLSIICFAALLAWPPHADAQAPSATPRSSLESFAESLEVRLVDIQVVVTDDDGRPVRGLAAEDFALRIAGEPTPLAFSTEIHDGRVRRPPGSGESGAAELDATPVAVGAAGDGRVPSSYLLFIDSFFTPVRYRSATLRYLAAEVTELLQAGDRMAVADYDGRNLSLVSDWNDDPESLRRKLLSLSGIATSIAWARRDLDPAENGKGLPHRAPARGTVSSRHAALRSAGSLLAVQQALGDPPGRKILVLLSGGWPRGSRHFDETLVEQVVASSNLLGYSIYPIHAARVIDEFGIAPPRAALAGKAGHFSLTWTSLADVAEATGGEVVSFAAGSPLERVIDDARSYYWLGFYHDAGGDGTSREIEVSVRRPGLEVRTRQSFLPLSRGNRARLQARAGAWLGSGSDDAPLTVEVGEARRIGLSRWRIPLSVTVPVHEITLLPTGDGRAGSLELRMAGLTKQGEPIDFPPVQLVVRESPEPGALTRTVHTVDVEVRRRELDLHLVLFDRNSERTYSAGVELGS